MEEHILPECYFDTVLIKTILKTKNRLNHKKGCNNVVLGITKSRLKDDFAVGIIDKDKKELDYLRDECNEEIKTEHLHLWKHKNKQHYFIQMAPAIERWLLQVSEESNVNLENFGLTKDLKRLKKYTKSELANENENLKNLCVSLVNGRSKTIELLSSWLKYLVENNRNADINTLKNV